MEREKWRRRELPAAEAALRLGMSRERLIRLIQNGQLEGRRDPRLGWLVGQAAVERLRRTHAAGRPRAGSGGRHG